MGKKGYQILGITLLASLMLWSIADTSEEVELAPYMGDLQRFSHKLGYAMEAENQKLSDFYLHEITEVFQELRAVKEHDGFPIGSTTQKIMNPKIEPLTTAIDRADWPNVKKHYLSLIEGCNDCHAATEHEFIIILPASGPSPFNQKF